ALLPPCAEARHGRIPYGLPGFERPHLPQADPIPDCHQYPRDFASSLLASKHIASRSAQIHSKRRQWSSTKNNDITMMVGKAIHSLASRRKPVECLPKAVVSASAWSRPMVSAAPPAANGTTTRTGLLGHSAAKAQADDAATAAMTARIRIMCRSRSLRLAISVPAYREWPKSLARPPRSSAT